MRLARESGCVSQLGSRGRETSIHATWAAVDVTVPTNTYISLTAMIVSVELLPDSHYASYVYEKVYASKMPRPPSRPMLQRAPSPFTLSSTASCGSTAARPSAEAGQVRELHAAGQRLTPSASQRQMSWTPGEKHDATRASAANQNTLPPPAADAFSEPSHYSDESLNGRRASAGYEADVFTTVIRKPSTSSLIKRSFEWTRRGSFSRKNGNPPNLKATTAQSSRQRKLADALGRFSLRRKNAHRISDSPSSSDDGEYVSEWVQMIRFQTSPPRSTTTWLDAGTAGPDCSWPPIVMSPGASAALRDGSRSQELDACFPSLSTATSFAFTNDSLSSLRGLRRASEPSSLSSMAECKPQGSRPDSASQQATASSGSRSHMRSLRRRSSDKPTFEPFDVLSTIEERFSETAFSPRLLSPKDSRSQSPQNNAIAERDAIDMNRLAPVTPDLKRLPSTSSRASSAMHTIALSDEKHAAPAKKLPRRLSLLRLRQGVRNAVDAVQRIRAKRALPTDTTVTDHKGTSQTSSATLSIVTPVNSSGTNSAQSSPASNCSSPGFRQFDKPSTISRISVPVLKRKSRTPPRKPALQPATTPIERHSYHALPERYSADRNVPDPSSPNPSPISVRPPREAEWLCSKRSQTPSPPSVPRASASLDCTPPRWSLSHLSASSSNEADWMGNLAPGLMNDSTTAWSMALASSLAAAASDSFASGSFDVSHESNDSLSPLVGSGRGAQPIHVL